MIIRKYASLLFSHLPHHHPAPGRTTDSKSIEELQIKKAYNHIIVYEAQNLIFLTKKDGTGGSISSSLMPRPSTSREEKGSGEFGPFPWFGWL